MSQQSVNDFLQATKDNSALANQVANASEPSVVVGIAADNGYEFTEEELVNALNEQQLEVAKEDLHFSESALALFEESLENDELRDRLNAAVNAPDTTGEIIRIANEKRVCVNRRRSY